MEEDIPAPRTDELVRAVADESDAIVTVMLAQVSGTGESQEFRPYVLSDSRAAITVDEPLGLAEEVFSSGRPRRGTATAGGERIVRIGLPLFSGGEVISVAIWSRSLEDVTEAVGLIRTQVIVSTGLALLVALIGGYLVARALARRVRRLEVAAQQVAAGNFTGPLPVDSEDELGQLTRTFNAMQAQLGQVDRARKEFIATASHELRTPIMSLGGFLELLLDEDLDAETREEFLRTMAEQIERLQKLSVDLLDLSRLDSGALSLALERVDLSEVARGVAAEFRPALRERAGDVTLNLGGGGVEAVADRQRVAQIMRILLDNALRHTTGGTPVRVSADRADAVARFAVSDGGNGLAPDAVSKLFERFYTADAARGSGLGLAIARELAELMEGRLGVRSGPGETVFTLELPAAGP